MPIPEIGWRVKGRLREVVDRRLVARRQRPLPWGAIAEGSSDRLHRAGDRVGGIWPEPGMLTDDDLGAGRARSLRQRADRILARRITLFDLTDHDLGGPVNYNYEYKAHCSTPMGYAGDIDYRDYRETGDCKFAWELSRFTHATALGRAYRLTGDRRYAEAVAEHLRLWMDQCPYGMGMQWRSGLELGVRLINWVWAVELVQPAGVFDAPFWKRLHGVVYRHLWEIARKYSRYSSANNHLIGEAAGVFIASHYFTALRGRHRWQAQSQAILEREIIAQTYDDGGTREQAMGYQCFVLEFLLLAGLIDRRGEGRFTSSYWSRLERMFDFLLAFAEGGEELPLVGDCDDGYVLDLSERAMTCRELLAIGAVLFDRPDFKVEARADIEPVFWLFGREGLGRYHKLQTDAVQTTLTSRGLASSGYYLLQQGRRRSAEPHQGGTVDKAGHRPDPDDDRISVMVDCGDLGLGPIAAHGHADALSLTVRAAGGHLLVDSGTYDYFTYGPWRDYFRSTRAHNTIVVDGQDQSQILGSFLWGERAEAVCKQWSPTEAGGVFVGEHTGYRRLPGAVTHRRTVALTADRQIRIEDVLEGQGEHEAAIYFHWGPACSIEVAGESLVTVDYGAGVARLEFDPRWAITTATGQESPILGWFSRAYHERTAISVLVGRWQWSGRWVSTCVLKV